MRIKEHPCGTDKPVAGIQTDRSVRAAAADAKAYPAVDRAQVGEEMFEQFQIQHPT
jgi:hypothetical protein